MKKKHELEKDQPGVKFCFYYDLFFLLNGIRHEAKKGEEKNSN